MPQRVYKGITYPSRGDLHVVNLTSLYIETQKLTALSMARCIDKDSAVNKIDKQTG